MAAWILVLTMSWGEQIKVPQQFDTIQQCQEVSDKIEMRIVGLKRRPTLECKVDD